MCGYGYLVGGAFDTTCVGKEPHNSGGTGFLLDVFELLPLDTEADDGFDERVIATAIELPFGPMVLGKIIEEAVAFLVGTRDIFNAVGIEEEFLDSGIFILTIVRISGRSVVRGTDIDGTIVIVVDVVVLFCDVGSVIDEGTFGLILLHVELFLIVCYLLFKLPDIFRLIHSELCPSVAVATQGIPRIEVTIFTGR